MMLKLINLSSFDRTTESLKYLLFVIVIFFDCSLVRASGTGNEVEQLIIKDKISQIRVLDSVKIQFILNDTLINGRDTVSAYYNPAVIETILNIQERHHGHIKVQPVYVSQESTLDEEGEENELYVFLGWIPGFAILIFIVFPTILSIIYFASSNLNKLMKTSIILLLIFVPITGIFIYPFRKKLTQ